MKAYMESEEDLKPSMKLLMQFGSFMRDEAKDRGVDALATELPFDQRAIIEVRFGGWDCFFGLAPFLHHF